MFSIYPPRQILLSNSISNKPWLLPRSPQLILPSPIKFLQIKPNSIKCKRIITELRAFISVPCLLAFSLILTVASQVIWRSFSPFSCRNGPVIAAAPGTIPPPVIPPGQTGYEGWYQDANGEWKQDPQYLQQQQTAQQPQQLSQVMILVAVVPSIPQYDSLKLWTSIFDSLYLLLKLRIRYVCIPQNCIGHTMIPLNLNRPCTRFP